MQESANSVGPTLVENKQIASSIIFFKILFRAAAFSMLHVLFLVFGRTMFLKME